jgi:Arc/MetJ-type ribon-helix-helix transcriptional regulator
MIHIAGSTQNLVVVGERLGSATRLILLGSTSCVTMYYMKQESTLTVRIDRRLAKILARACATSGRSRSDVVRDALKRQLALMQFQQLRRKVMPFAEGRGYLTDEDVFRDVS